MTSLRPLNSRRYNTLYTVNENFLDEVDNQFNAYFLGFMYADGYNSGRTLTINVSSKDLPILELFKRCIEYTGPIYSYKNCLKGKEFRHNRLAITSQYLCDRLTKLGCTKAKTHTITFPDWLNRDTVSHFIRGYFDGDGCVSKDLKSNGVRFMGTELFCLGLQSALLENAAINSSVFKYRKDDTSLMYVLSINGYHQINRFSEFLYQGSEIHLERKKERFDILAADTGNHPPYRSPSSCSICGKGGDIVKGLCKDHYNKEYQADNVARSKQKYYQANKEKLAAKGKGWYEANKERKMQKQRELKQRKKEQSLLIAQQHGK